MIFPEKPTIHANAWPVPKDFVQAWSDPRLDDEYGQHEGFRRCNYCGSIHPEDLIRLIESEGAEIHGADWKYGWPHKFYVENIPNLFQGDECRRGSKTENGVTILIMGKPSVALMAKWYNEHLLDEGFDQEARSKLIEVLAARSDIRFNVTDDGRLGYSAPHRGYQK